MSTVKGADIFGAPAATQLAIYADSQGFKIVGGYAYDDDVLGRNPWTVAHVAALAKEGIKFLPIITMRNATSATAATLEAALKAVGCPTGPVAFDREDSTALPSQAVMTAIVGALRAAGYGPMIGYRWPWANCEAWYADLMDSLWAAIPGGSSVPPSGAKHVQYGQAGGYDLDTFDMEAIFPAPEEDDLTPAQAQQLSDLHAWIAGTGNHTWFAVQDLQKTVAQLQTELAAIQKKIGA